MFIRDYSDIQKISQTLNRKFADNDIKSLPGRGGTTQKYVEGNAVIDRLNEAFSPLGWSYSCRQVESLGDAAQSKQIAVYGELTIEYFLVSPDGQMVHTGVTKGQWGSREVKSNDTGTAKMEYGDDLKSASTDALKKCATLFGIGNHLYRKPGAKIPEKSVVDLTKTLDAIRQAKGLTVSQMLDFCSGVAHKTIENSGDLSLTQIQACIEMLKGHPVIGQPAELPAKEQVSAKEDQS